MTTWTTWTTDHVHTRRCHWDVEHARWTCPGPLGAAATPPPAPTA